MRPEPPNPHPHPDPREIPPSIPGPEPFPPTKPEIPQIDPGPEVVPPSIPTKPDLPPIPHSEPIPHDVEDIEVDSPIGFPKGSSDIPEESPDKLPKSEGLAGEPGNRDENPDAEEGNAYKWSTGGDEVRALVVEPSVEHESDARPEKPEDS